MVNKVYCTTMKLLAALFLLTAVDCKSLVKQKTLLEQNTDQNPRKRINTKDAKPLDGFRGAIISPFNNQANKRLSSDYFNMDEIMDRMWDKDDYSDNNRESLLRTPIYHAYNEENENTYKDDTRRDKLLSNEHKRKYRNIDDEDVDLMDLTRQGSDFARLNADDHNIVAKSNESDCKKILNKILLILLQYLNKPDEPLSQDEILRKILLIHLGKNKLSLEHNNPKVNIDTVDLTRGGSSKYDLSAESTSDKNNIVQTVLKVKQLLQSKITVNVGDIVDVIIKHTRPVLIKTGQELCKNLAMEYLITSVNEAYEHLLNSTTCSDAYKKNNNVTFEKKSKELANVIDSLQSDELTKLILSSNLSDYIKEKVRKIIDESHRISKENDTQGLQDKLSNLADHSDVRSRERSKKRSSDKFLRQILFNTVHSKIIEEQCDKTAVDTFLKTVTLIILRAKNMKCNSFTKKNNLPILRSEVKELLFSDQNYVTEDSNDMFDSVEDVRQANSPVNIIKDLLLKSKKGKILDSLKIGKKSNELNNVLKLIKNDSTKDSNLLRQPKSQRRPSLNLLKKKISYFEQESDLNLNTITNNMKNINTEEENDVPNLQQLPNNDYRVKYNEIKKKSLDGTNSTDHVTEKITENLILSYVDDIIQELAGNAANTYKPRDFQDSVRNEKYKILEKVKPTARDMEKPKLYKYQSNNHKLKFSKVHKHRPLKFFGPSSQHSAIVSNPLNPDQLKVSSNINTVKEFVYKEKHKENFINYDLPYSQDEIKSKITILPEKAIVNMKNLPEETDKSFQNVSTKSYSPLISFDYYLNESDDENVLPINYKDDIPLKSSNNYRKHKSDENNITEYLNEYVERTRGSKSDDDDSSNVEASALKITEAPKSVQLQLNSLPLTDGLQQHLNFMKNLSQSSRDVNFTSAENAVELTYIVRHPEVIMYQPLTKIKFHLPYKYYTENQKEIVNEVQNKKQFRLVKVVKLLSKGNEILYETKDPESNKLIFNRQTLNLKPDTFKEEKKTYKTNDSLQRDENLKVKKEIGAEISETKVINDKSNNKTEGSLKDLINVLAEIDISESLDNKESKNETQIFNADHNRTSEINSFRVDSTELNNFQIKHGPTVDGHNNKLHMNIDGKIVWNNYPISNIKYTQRKTRI